MKIIVNPAYEHLRKFVESIPDIFESEGRVIYSGRNLIKVMTVDDGLEGAPFHIPIYCFREALKPLFLFFISINLSGA